MRTTFITYIFKPLVALTLLMSLNFSCTNLDITTESEYSGDNFPSTELEFISVAGSAYKSLQTQIALSYWFLQELSSDEAMLRARGADWYDGGRYQQLFLHTWTADHPIVLSTWEWGFNGINSCNLILKLFETAPETETKPAFIAEIKAIRAFYYFMMMDLYGDIPVVTTFGDVSQPSRMARKDVFTFIETELNTALPNLSDVVDGTTYGRPTKWMAYSFLAKMYMNAQVYTGTQRYQDALNACNQVIKSGKYSLETDYMKVFAPDNGHQIKENIFVVPFDPIQAPQHFIARYTLHPSTRNKFGIPFNPSNALVTPEDFYNLYNESADKRKAQWLAGKQYNADGTAIIIKTTNKGLDATYSGANPTAAVDYHLEHTPAITLVNEAGFSTGTDQLGLAMGVRNVKYFPDKNSPTRNQNNDFVVFRYADILLMKAEAMLRGATDSEGSTALNLVNQVRTRAGLAEWGAIDLTTLFEERSREMAYEGWRRNDLIRFGKWEDAWKYKTDNRTSRRIYPVPTNELTLNPNLGQNPEY
jgi:starch-binding outer membrane protein, SusD/RagB family